MSSHTTRRCTKVNVQVGFGFTERHGCNPLTDTEMDGQAAPPNGAGEGFAPRLAAPTTAAGPDVGPAGAARLPLLKSSLM